MTPRSGFPTDADAWLVPAPDARVLAVGHGTAAMAHRLAARGAQVTLIDHDFDAVMGVRTRFPHLRVVAAAADTLPFPPTCFDAVVIAQGVHLLGSGLAEFARVLAPDGRLAIAHTTRDDSVPWVRRLAGVLRAYDPDLMTTGRLDSPDALSDHPCFPEVEAHSFRMWVPITREGMVTMVTSNPRLSALAEADAIALAEEVGAIYDTSAKPPEPLSLPYAVQCWRAVVDHTEIEDSLELLPDGLQILL